MQSTNGRIPVTEANHLDRCIFSTGILQFGTVTIGRLLGWSRCEMPFGCYGNWFLMFIYPLYEITQLDNEVQKNMGPGNIPFMCLYVHGCAAVDIIHKFSTCRNESKFAIAFMISKKKRFHFTTVWEETFTFEVILIRTMVFLSGNAAPLFNNFYRRRRRELALMTNYISMKNEFFSRICEMSEKNIEVIVIFEDEDGFNASGIELKQEMKKLRNLTRRVCFVNIAIGNQSNEAIPVIDLAESENTNTLHDISETSRKSNQLEMPETERKIKSRISTNSEEVRHTEENIESLWKTVTGQCMFGKRRVTDDYSVGSCRSNQPQFLPTSFKILDSLQPVTMSVMIDCNSPQTELRSRGAYDLEFDKFLANKDK